MSKRTDPLQQGYAALGMVALLAQPLLLGVRSRLLDHALSYAKLPNDPLVKIVFSGFNYPIGTGAAFTLAQMICASVFLVHAPASPHRRCLRVLSALGWSFLSAVDLIAGTACTDGDAMARTAGFAVALAALLFETMCGVLILDGLFVPLWAGILRRFERHAI